MAITIKQIQTAETMQIQTGSQLNDNELDSLENELGRISTLVRPAIPFGWEKRVNGYLFTESDMLQEAVNHLCRSTGVMIAFGVIDRDIKRIFSKNKEERHHNLIYTLEYLSSKAPDQERAIREALDSAEWAYEKYPSKEVLYKAFVQDIQLEVGTEPVIYQSQVDKWSTRLERTKKHVEKVVQDVNAYTKDQLIAWLDEAHMTREQFEKTLAYALTVLDEAHLNIEDPLRERAGYDIQSKEMGDVANPTVSDENSLH